MYAVEIPLRSGELSSQMSAMRMWLDEKRVESSKFTCQDSGCGMRVCIEFKVARDAEEFAKRFSGKRKTRPGQRILQERDLRSRRQAMLAAQM